MANVINGHYWLYLAFPQFSELQCINCQIFSWYFYQHVLTETFCSWISHLGTSGPQPQLTYISMVSLKWAGCLRWLTMWLADVFVQYIKIKISSKWSIKKIQSKYMLTKWFNKWQTKPHDTALTVTLQYKYQHLQEFELVSLANPKTAYLSLNILT